MKKKIAISIDEECFKYLEDNYLNASAFLNALILRQISMKKTTNHTNSEIE